MNKLLVKAVLKGEVAKKFLEIKQNLGVESNAEVLRILINKRTEET